MPNEAPASLDIERTAHRLKRPPMPATLILLTDPTPEHLTVLPAPGDPDGHPITHPYIDTLWLPVLGPTAIAALRLIDRLAASNPDRFTLTLDQLGHRIGLAGKAAPQRAARTIDRLIRFHVAVTVSPDEIIVPLRLPPLSNRQLDRLPPYIARLERGLRHPASRTA